MSTTNCKKKRNKYNRPMNILIVDGNEKKGLNVDFIIREDIDWESLFNKMQ